MGVIPPDTTDNPPPRMFDPIDQEVLFVPAEGGFTPAFPEREPLAYQRYVRLRSTATRIEASRHTLYRNILPSALCLRLTSGQTAARSGLPPAGFAGGR
jgi:hypothetical protein